MLNAVLSVCPQPPASLPGAEGSRSPIRVAGRTTDRHLPIYCVHGVLRMPHPKELVEKGSRGWDARLNMHNPYSGIVELAFRGRATLELGPAPTLASIDFRGHFYSVLARSWG